MCLDGNRVEMCTAFPEKGLVTNAWGVISNLLQPAPQCTHTNAEVCVGVCGCVCERTHSNAEVDHIMG